MSNEEILIFSDSVTEGVKAERLALKAFAESHLIILNNCATGNEYIYKSNAPLEYMNLLKFLPASPMKILDIGVGRGESSLFLSSLGHQVFAVEPSNDFCKLIKSAAFKFGLPVTICQGVAEDLDRLRETNFDVVFFNASLHHCDNAFLALQHAYQSLRPGGYICLVSELHIRPWVSKGRWYRRLETNPTEMGHYGGNEHAYYGWEYVNLLSKSGFVNLSILPMTFNFSALDRLSDTLSKRINGVRVFNSTGVLVRFSYYIAMEWIKRVAPLFRLLSKMSIEPANYLAHKPS